MKENEKAIDELLQEEGYSATTSAKQAISDFSILYARKLLHRCLAPNKDTISADDLRLTYETMNKIHSMEYDDELEKKKMNMINYVVSLSKQKFEKTPAKANTVSLNFKNDLSHMRTNWQFQLAFDNSGI